MVDGWALDTPTLTVGDIGDPGTQPAREVLLDLPPDAFRNPKRRRRIGARHQDHELLPAVPRADVEDAHRAPQDVGDFAQHAVAHQMPLRSRSDP